MDAKLTLVTLLALLTIRDGQPCSSSKENNPTVPEKFWYNSDVISAWPGFDSPLFKFPLFIKLPLSIQPP